MRFFPLTVEEHFKAERDTDFWYFNNLYYNVTQGSLDCCSDTVAGLHYIDPTEMYMLDYLIYRVNPYGVEQPDDKKPPKFALAEIIRRSNEKSSSKAYVEHELIRDIEDSEKFKR